MSRKNPAESFCRVAVLISPGVLGALSLGLGTLLILCGLNLLAYRDGNIRGFSFSVDRKGQLITNCGFANDAYQFGTAGDLLAINVGDNIIDLNTGLGGRGVGSHCLDRSAFGQTVALGLGAHGGSGQTYIGLGYIAFFDDAFSDLPGFINGNGKTNIING